MLPGQMTQEAPGRRGNYQHTSTGRKYFPFDPRPEEVNIQFIAHHLATCARFNGATQHPNYPDRIIYTVAEHSVWVSLYIEHILDQPEYALEGLLHDASEAPIGDLIRPLKYSPAFRQPFKDVETLNERVIAEAFNIQYPYPEAVAIADEAVCAAEVIRIVPRDPLDEWESGKLHDDSRVAPYEIEMWFPWIAKRRFLERFKELAAARSRYRPLPARHLL